MANDTSRVTLCRSGFILWGYFDDCPDACGKWWQIFKRLSYDCFLCRVDTCIRDHPDEETDVDEAPATLSKEEVKVDIIEGFENALEELEKI